MRAETEQNQAVVLATGGEAVESQDSHGQRALATAGPWNLTTYVTHSPCCLWRRPATTNPGCVWVEAMSTWHSSPTSTRMMYCSSGRDQAPVTHTHKHVCVSGGLQTWLCGLCPSGVSGVVHRVSQITWAHTFLSCLHPTFPRAPGKVLHSSLLKNICWTRWRQ